MCVCGGGGGFAISSDGVFEHTCYRHIHDILTFHTWPAAFYFIWNYL